MHEASGSVAFLSALFAKVNPEAAGFVLNNRVGLAYEKAPLIEDVDKVRHNLTLLVRAARALAKAQDRLLLAA